MKAVDLFMFMGQSNMSGRGLVDERWPDKAPKLIPGAGYEFRSMTDPTRLYEIAEPFGVNENNLQGLNDKDCKTGSMVTAFINAYYETCGVPIIGVSASKGGTSLMRWQPERGYSIDARERLLRSRAFLKEQGIEVRHVFMLWCQGESDADVHRSAQEYKTLFVNMLEFMKEAGIEHCFMIQIGEYNGPKEDVDYGEIRQAQEQLAMEREDVTMVSRLFVTMKERGLMRDWFHYYQKAYNEVGTDAGINTARWVYENKE